jgi:hypothetical protein
MKQEITVKTGTPVDFSNVKVPLYGINDQAYLLHFGKVIKVDILGVELKLKWFDNNYTSRYEWEIRYELGNADGTTPWFEVWFEEHDLFKDLASVTLAAKEYELKKFVERKDTLENNIRVTENALATYKKQYQELLK